MAEAEIFITADASQAEAELARFQAEWKAAMTTLSGGVTDAARRIALASGVAFAGQAAVVGLAYAALATYEFALRQTAVIAGLNEDQMWQLNDAINASAVRWGVAGDEIANGALVLAKAGLAGQEIIDIIDTITQSVLANGISWEAAAQAFVVATTAFANQGLTAVEVFDMLQTAANISLLNVEDFARAFGFAAGTIRLAGGTMEQFLALMVQLVNAGQQAGISARGINQMIINLVENADAVQAWADSLGLGVQVIVDGKLNLLELVAAYDKLGVSMDVDQLQTFFTFLNTNAARAFSFLLLNADQLPGAIDAITNSSGSLATVAGETANSLKSMWQQIVQTFLVSLRNKDVVDALAGAFDTLKLVLEASGPAFREILVTIIRDFAANLPQLLSLLQNLLNLAQSLLPVWNTFAQIGLLLAQAFLALPAPVQNFIILMTLMNRILPVTTMLGMLDAIVKLRAGFATMASQALPEVLEQFRVAEFRALLMRRALIGVGLAAAGIGTAFLAMGAESREAAAFFSVLTGVMWALAAAQFAVVAAQAGIIANIPGVIAAVAVISGAIAAISTYIAAAAAHKSYEEGTPYVPETGTYLLHKGERVLTADENREYASDLISAGVPIPISPDREHVVAQIAERTIRRIIPSIQTETTEMILRQKENRKNPGSITSRISSAVGTPSAISAAGPSEFVSTFLPSVSSRGSSAGLNESTAGGILAMETGGVVRSEEPFVASFARGTPFVPETGIYLLHRGEGVMQAMDNPLRRAVAASAGISTASGRQMFTENDLLINNIMNTRNENETRNLAVAGEDVTNLLVERGRGERSRANTPENVRDLLDPLVSAIVSFSGAAPAARERGAVKAGSTFYGGVHGGTVNLNFYDAAESDIRHALARFGL